ncbi:MAG: class I SAM-dependent methyltransferase [Tardiphaga sp.]|nr:class I SAM-dependent methyltransferase [Tardiphaga sp.]
MADPLITSNATAHWNSRFAGDDFLFGTEPNNWLREHTGSLPSSSRVLCVADGEGRNSVFLAQQGLTVDAFDISDVAIAKARQLATAVNVTVNFHLADCDSFAWQRSAYDGVAAIFVQFADPALRRRLFTRMTQSLRPGGLLILQGYTPEQLDYKTGGPSELSHLYTETILRELLAELTIKELRVYEEDISEGCGHRGRSALIGVVAQR